MEGIAKKSLTSRSIFRTFVGDEKSAQLPAETTFRAMRSSTVPSAGAELKSFSVFPQSMSIPVEGRRSRLSRILKRWVGLHAVFGPCTPPYPEFCESCHRMESGVSSESPSSKEEELTWSEPETLSDSEVEFEMSWQRMSATSPFGWSYASMLCELGRDLT